MSKIRVAGHSLHPMLVVFPLGLLATSLVWDIVYLASGNSMWATTSFWTIVAGVAGGLLAAIPGLVDWLAIPRTTRAWKIGLYHMLLNLAVVGLFVLSAALRWATGYSTPGIGHMISGWVGIGLALVSGWLGGELVERLGVAVYSDAHLDAPSSLAPSSRRREKLGPRIPGGASPRPVT